MKHWVKKYIKEIERIEHFFVKRYEEYKHELEQLNVRYLHKTAENRLDDGAMQDRSEISIDEGTRTPGKAASISSGFRNIRVANFGED